MVLFFDDVPKREVYAAILKLECARQRVLVQLERIAAHHEHAAVIEPALE